MFELVVTKPDSTRWQRFHQSPDTAIMSWSLIVAFLVFASAGYWWTLAPTAIIAGVRFCNRKTPAVYLTSHDFGSPLDLPDYDRMRVMWKRDTPDLVSKLLSQLPSLARLASNYTHRDRTLYLYRRAVWEAAGHTVTGFETLKDVTLTFGQATDSYRQHEAYALQLLDAAQRLYDSVAANAPAINSVAPLDTLAAIEQALVELDALTDAHRQLKALDAANGLAVQ